MYNLHTTKQILILPGQNYKKEIITEEGFLLVRKEANFTSDIPLSVLLIQMEERNRIDPFDVCYWGSQDETTITNEWTVLPLGLTQFTALYFTPLGWKRFLALTSPPYHYKTIHKDIYNLINQRQLYARALSPYPFTLPFMPQTKGYSFVWFVFVVLAVLTLLYLLSLA